MKRHETMPRSDRRVATATTAAVTILHYILQRETVPRKCLYVFCSDAPRKYPLLAGDVGQVRDRRPPFRNKFQLWLKIYSFLVVFVWLGNYYHGRRYTLLGVGSYDGKAP